MTIPLPSLDELPDYDWPEMFACLNPEFVEVLKYDIYRYGLAAYNKGYKAALERKTGPLTAADVQQLKAKIQSPEDAVKFLRDAGFITPDGKLAAQFGGSVDT